MGQKGYNNSMKSLFSKRRLVVGTVVVLFLLSLNLVSSQVREVATSLSSSAQSSLWRAGSFFSGGSLSIENETLTKENLALLSEVIALQDVKRENEELRAVMDLGLAEEFELALGEIIGKNLGQDVITIRGGQNKGMEKGMPVITSEKVAVGRIIESFGAFARVQLISAKESRLDARIDQTEITGVTRGQGGQKLVLDLVRQEDEFHVGDVVVTSNLSDFFPENLLIGRVEEIVKTGADPFQKANVKPFFNLKSAELVFVITSFSL